MQNSNKIGFNTLKIGRPPKDRIALARAFVAKAVLNLPTTDRNKAQRYKTRSQAERVNGDVEG